jgi:hypothetical protein
METKLTDFSYDDLLWMSVLLRDKMKREMEHVEFLRENYPDSDLLPVCEDQYDKAQRWATQVKEAAIKIGMQERIKMN